MIKKRQVLQSVSSTLDVALCRFSVHLKLTLVGLCILGFSLVVLLVPITFPKSSKYDQHDRCECNHYDHDPAFDISHKDLSSIDPLSNTSSWVSIEKHHPNFPIFLLKSPQEKCNLMPSVFDIKWTGVHWQEMIGPKNEKYLLYSAFYDNRTKTTPTGGTVRVLALVNDTLDSYFPEYPHCHFWYNDKGYPVHSKVSRIDYIDWQYRDNDRLMCFLLTCPVPQRSDNHIPSGVSLVSRPCTKASNLLKVIGSADENLELNLKKSQPSEDITDPQFKVGVCGPALYYYQQDFSIRLIEWLELMKSIGVAQVFFYTTKGIHPNIEKVLLHYEREGFVTLTDFHYPPPYMDDPLIRRLWTNTERLKMFTLENVYFSDCLLRNKDSYRFLTHIDPDEFPVLLKHENLSALVHSLNKVTSKWSEQPPGYPLFWQYFPLDLKGKTLLPDHFFILNHDKKRSYDYDPKHYNVKSIYDTSDATAAISHLAVICAAGTCNPSQTVSVNIAYLGHFRSDCGKECMEDVNTVEEVQEMHKYIPLVKEKIENVLKTLELVKS